MAEMHVGMDYDPGNNSRRTIFRYIKHPVGFNLPTTIDVNVYYGRISIGVSGRVNGLKQLYKYLFPECIWSGSLFSWETKDT